MGKANKYNAKKKFELNGKTYNYFDLKVLEEAGLGDISRLPFSVRVLLESVLRQYDGQVIKDEHIEGLTKWGTKAGEGVDVPFKPSRVILQDFTGVPAVVDLASLRKAMVDMRSEERRVGKGG